MSILPTDPNVRIQERLDRWCQLYLGPQEAHKADTYEAMRQCKFLEFQYEEYNV